MKIIARKEAKAAGLKRYFTGRPCLRGHVVERYVGDKTCAACKTVWVAINGDKHRASTGAWQKANAEKCRAYTRTNAMNNPDKIRDRNRKFRAANPDKLRKYNRDGTRKWRENHRGAANALTAKRRAWKRNATPPWSNLELIKAVYEAAARKGLVVDHVIPLKHPIVCGLHVPFNLQLLTASANSRKGNTWPTIQP